MSSAVSPAVAASLPWRRSLAWLLFLGPFFFLSYGYSNRLAADHAVTDALFFEWERHIPFLPWTILPYWSIDLFYGLSFLLCRNRLEVDRHALRLLSAQLVSVTFFVLYPLHFSFERPVTDGVFGALFDALMGFDKPYNQAPSLHIGLLVIIWARFATSTPAAWRPFVDTWAALIGLSVLTTYQHHFIDIPTGALVGLMCLWAWPDAGEAPLAKGWFTDYGPRRRLAIYYLLGSIVLLCTAILLGGTALWLCWGAAACGLVAVVYAVTGAMGFQKKEGKHSLAIRLLLAPYMLCAWLNSRWWTRERPKPDVIADNVWLGRLPTTREMAGSPFSALCDLTAELPAPCGNWRYVGLPWLDMVAPDQAQLMEAAQRIEDLRSHGPLLVCCALGYSRSACAVAAWLLLTGRAASVEAAESMLLARRPRIVFGEAHRAVLASLAPVTDARKAI